MNTIWRVERTLHRRFPFRISIEQDGRRVIAVRASAAWPGPGENIFCLREREFDPGEPLEVVEEAPVSSLGRVGRKLTVVLDRPMRKRCEFLVVEKMGREGRAYEQVFFRTESGIRAHRSRTRVELRSVPTQISVVIDSGERYPWRFPGATVSRRKLPVGDYGLMLNDELAAVVERKSFDNILSDIGALQALHHQLADLGSVPVSAFVIEAEYRDFQDASRLAGRWPAVHLSRVLGELSALHPRLPIIFAGNRKAANAWTHQFFLSLASRREAPSPQLVLETMARYDASERPESLDERIRRVALTGIESPFSIASLCTHLAGVDKGRVRRVVDQLRREGLVTREGHGRGARWVRTKSGVRG
jgi:ERCC4-type nuclease